MIKIVINEIIDILLVLLIYYSAAISINSFGLNGNLFRFMFYSMVFAASMISYKNIEKLRW